jgi:hypothetical protein
MTKGLRFNFSQWGGLAIVGLCLAVGSLAWSGAASAEKAGGKGAPPPAQKAPPQVALTPKHIESFIAGYKDLTPLLEKLGNLKKADPKLEAQVDNAVKKYGFAGLDDFDAVTNSIFAVLGGIDPKTKQYSDPIAGLKKELAEVQADKTMKPADRKKALQSINEQLKQAQPVEHPGNIPLVVKYFDQLNAILPSEEPQQAAPPPAKKGKK